MCGYGAGSGWDAFASGVQMMQVSSDVVRCPANASFAQPRAAFADVIRTDENQRSARNCQRMRPRISFRHPCDCFRAEVQFLEATPLRASEAPPLRIASLFNEDCVGAVLCRLLFHPLHCCSFRLVFAWLWGDDTYDNERAIRFRLEVGYALPRHRWPRRGLDWNPRLDRACRQ
jgi:hypothetical protein